MAEPIRSAHASILHRLSEMQRAPYYAIARDDLRLAGAAIVGLEAQLAQTVVERDALRADPPHRSQTKRT